MKQPITGKYFIKHHSPTNFSAGFIKKKLLSNQYLVNYIDMMMLIAIGRIAVNDGGPTDDDDKVHADELKDVELFNVCSVWCRAVQRVNTEHDTKSK